MKEENYNPWSSVRKWEEFLYFCCPECNEKSQSKETFIKHALSVHPMAQMCFESIEPDVQLKETNRINESGPYINEEYSEENNAYEQKLTIAINEDPLVIVKNEIIEQSESEEIYHFDSIKDEDTDIIDENKHEEWKNTSNHYDALLEANLDLKQPIIVLNRIDAKKNESKVNHSENKCNLCNEVFSKKSSLIFHISVEHPETKYADGVDLDQKDGDLHFKKHETFIKKPIRTISKKPRIGYIKTKNMNNTLFIEVWDRIMRSPCETCGNEKCFTCHTCNMQFPSKSNTLSHIAQEHKDQRPYKCEFCTLDFNVKEHYRKHIIGVHDERNRETKVCEICKKSVNSLYYSRHVERVHNNKKESSTCPICNKTFSGSASGYLRIHMKSVHEKKRLFKCKLCIKDFAYQEGYNNHMRTIHENVKFLCDICGVNRTQNIALRKHKTKKHEDEINEQYKDKGSPFPCNICEKVLYSSQLLKNHLQFMHTLLKDEVENTRKNLGVKLKKAIKCQFCDNVFNFRSTLSNHVNVVHNGTTYSCEFCGKVSSSANNLKLHIEAIHKRSTKTPCEICGKVFRDRTVMKFHVRTVHEKIKDFVCQECGKGFTKTIALNVHLAIIHSMGSTHDCQACGKKFGKKQGLKLHIDTVHKGIKHQCDQCSSAFTQIGNLRLHIQKHHT